MAKKLVQVLVTPRNIKKWFTVKNEATNGALTASVDSLAMSTYTTDVVELEDSKVEITTTHTFANDTDYDAYVTWWSQFDAEKAAYHTANGMTSTSTTIDV